MGRRYVKRKPGEWFPWVAKGNRWACCDCGLVHIVRHKRTARGHTLVQMFRDERATAGKRRGAAMRASIASLLKKM